MKTIAFRRAVVPAVLFCITAGGCAPGMREKITRPRSPDTAAAAVGEEADELRKIFQAAEDSYSNVDDYSCVFYKRQRLGGRLQDRQKIILKFREPMDVYMKWLKGPHEGQEVLYSPSLHGEKGLARAGGRLGRWAPVIRIDRDGYWVMRDNIHPLDHVGIGYYLDTFMENSRRARETEAGSIIDRGEGEVGGRPARVIECLLPPEKEKGFYCYRCVVWFDRENHLPIRMEMYDWDERLVEEYEYRDLAINTGLTDRDFDRDNPSYNF